MAAASPSRTAPDHDTLCATNQPASDSSSSSGQAPTSALTPTPTPTLARPSLSIELPPTPATIATGIFRSPAFSSSRTDSSNSASSSASNNSSLLDDDWLAAGMVTPQPGSPRASSSRVRSRSSSNLDQDLELDYIYRTPPPRAPFTHPPSPPKPGLGQYSPVRDPSQLKQYATYLAHNPLWIFHSAQLSAAGNQHQQFASFSAPYNMSTSQDPPPRKPLTSIAGSSRCLWPPNSTFLTTSNHVKEKHRPLESHEKAPEGTLSATTVTSHKHHSRSDSFKDARDSMQELQPRRKARRMMDEPYFKERNHLMVARHVQKLIQEAVEDGVGELDLSNLDLNDLPPDIRDLNYAIVYSERGTFSLSKNRLKLFLSSNQFSTVPMDVFALQNLSVLSLRNNHIEAIPPEIGQLHNLVELSLGGNLLKHLPSQIALLPRLKILTVHPNPFLKPAEIPAGGPSDESHEPTPPAPVAENASVNPPSQTFAGHAVLTGLPMLNLLPTTDPEPLALQASSSQLSLLSPPASPLSGVQDDVDMESGPHPMLEHAGSAEGSGSVLDTNTSANDVMNTDANLSQDTDISSEDTTLTEESWVLPPHEITRTRFPSLLILAGNAILNHMEQQQQHQQQQHQQQDRQQQEQQHNEVEVKEHSMAGNNGLITERPRMDSKISLFDFEPVSGGENILCDQQRRQPYVITEEAVKSYLTPFLYSLFTRARANRRCAGCQRLFLKPCRVMIVWQEVLGQNQIPIQWKGCGIDKCPGVPLKMWSPPLTPLPSLTPFVEPPPTSSISAPLETSQTPVSFTS